MSNHCYPLPLSICFICGSCVPAKSGRRCYQTISNASQIALYITIYSIQFLFSPFVLICFLYLPLRYTLCFPFFLCFVFLYFQWISFFLSLHLSFSILLRYVSLSPFNESLPTKPQKKCQSFFYG